MSADRVKVELSEQEIAAGVAAFGKEAAKLAWALTQLANALRDFAIAYVRALEDIQKREAARSEAPE